MAADDITERDMGIARVVDAVADDLRVSLSQVALAWTMPAARPSTRSSGPGASTSSPTTSAPSMSSSRPEARARLDELSAVMLGFPLDFIAPTRGFVYGEAGERVDGRPPRTPP